MKRTTAAFLIALGMTAAAGAAEPVALTGAACTTKGSCGSACNNAPDYPILAKLKGWFTYRACEKTAPCCEPSLRVPPVYTFFVTPCREGPKPACCDKSTWTGCTGFLGSGHRVFSQPTGHGCSPGLGFGVGPCK